MPEKRHSPGKKILFTGIFVSGSLTLSLLLLLIILEVVLRMTTAPFVTPGYTRTHFERRYELRPNFRGRTYEAALSINSYGLRDEERPISGENQAYRIAVFGDSVTFGIGVESEDTFPKLMERHLNDAYDSEIQVFNFGVPSYNTVNEYHYFRERYDQFTPHAVIFQFLVGNDTILSNPPGSPKGINRFRGTRMVKDLLRHLYSYEFLAVRYYRLRYDILFRNLQRQAAPSSDMRKAQEGADTEEVAAREPHDEKAQAPAGEVAARMTHDARLYADEFQGWVEAQYTFGEIAEFCREKQIPVIFAVLANNVELAHSLEEDQYYPLITKIQEALYAQGIDQILIIDEAFRGYAGQEPLLWVKPDDAHFSVLAHQLAAELLYRYIQEHQLIEAFNDK